MQRLIVSLLVVAFSSPTWAGLPGSWKDILKDPSIVKSPTAADVHLQAVPMAEDFQLFDVEGRYGFLFDPAGYPVVVFDYAMEDVKTKDAFMGAIGIGGWSLNNLFKNWKKYREDAKKVVNAEMTMDPWEVPAFTDGEKANGYKAFAKFEFRDEWIKQNGHLEALAQGKRSGFAPATFSMGDIYLTPDNEAKVTNFMKDFSRVIYRQELESKDVVEFLKQFEMKWDSAAEDFKMVWHPQVGNSVLKKEKAPVLPNWIVNFAVPYDVLAYKYYLRNLEEQTAIFDKLGGQWGHLFGIMVSQAVTGIKIRYDIHENALQQVLERVMRHEAELPIPLRSQYDFANISTDILYLNKLIKTANIVDGQLKRKTFLAKEAKNKRINLEWFAKKGYTIENWADDRFATASKDGKRKGVVSLTLPKRWYDFTPSFHVYEKATWYKPVARVGMQLLNMAVRMFLSDGGYSGINIPIGNVQFYAYMPAYGWDIILRSRIFEETAYEGLAVGQIDSYFAGHGKAIPGYTDAELVNLRKTMFLQRMNPFEPPASHEGQVLKHTKKLVTDFLGAMPSDPASLTTLPASMIHP